MATESERLVLVTGATGYVGRQLFRRLGPSTRVRCMARDKEKLANEQHIEAVTGDVFDAESVRAACEGVDTAYYLIHSMADSTNFESKERNAAEIFVEAADAAGVKRIIYLGGLGDAGAELSAHLRSRQEVGRVLASRAPECIEFRASVIIGAGSASFELVRDLTERLPLMLTPQWLRTPTQPIGIDNLLAYLEAALHLPREGSRVFEIGGADRTTYAGIIKAYAKERGLSRVLVPVPVLTPELSRLWLYLIAPREAGVGQSLVGSLKNPTVVRDPSARDVFPDIVPESLEVVMRRAVSERNVRKDAA